MNVTDLSFCETARRRRRLQACVLLAAVALGIACSGNPERKKQSYVESGDAYRKQGNLAAAVIEYRNAVQIDARFGEARAKLAEAYLRLGDGGNALREYVRAADLLPDDADVQLAAGSLLLATGQTNEALGRADGVLAKHPDNVAAHVLRGNALGGLDDLEKALKEMEEAIRLDPLRASTYTQLGFVQLARGREKEAEAALNRAVELAPKSVSNHLALANFYWTAKRIEDAEKAFDRALELEPTNEGANRAMAVFTLTTGRAARAEQYLKRVADTSKSASALFALSDYYVAQNRPKDAIALLQTAAEKGAAVAGAQQRLARAYASAGDRGTAHRLTQELITKDPRNAQAQLLKAQLEFEEGHRDEALASVQAAVAAEPASAQAQFALGKLYASRGDVRGAEKAFTEVLKQNPRAAAAQMELSLLRLHAGNPQGSLELARDAAATQPRNATARLTLIRSLIATKDYDQASQEITKLIEAQPKLSEAYVLKGTLAAIRRDPAGARTAFDTAQQLDPKSVDALGGLIMLDLERKDFDAAKNRIAPHVAAENPSTRLLILAGRTYAATKDFDLAEKSLRRAIQIDPSFLPGYSMLGQLYVSQKKLNEAYKEFDNLAQRHSNPVSALTMSGIVLQTLNRTPEARQRYEQAVAIDRTAAVAANNLAWIYAEAGEHLDEAMRLAESAAQTLPDVAEIQDTLGYVYERNNLPALAIPTLSRLVEKEPKNATYHYHLGLAYEKAGDVARSRQALNTALTLKADFDGADEARRILARSTDSRK
jgi:tetratricopeptide (TPR) repeat protein